MPALDADKITQELNRLFSEPLKEFYDRRIIVWKDEEREFEDKLDEIHLNNAKIVALTGSNQFAVKKLLCADDKFSNYLLYCPTQDEDLENDWLLDVKLYSEEFRADLLSIWMDEMNLPNTPAMRKTARHYRNFLNAKERRGKISALSKPPQTPFQMHLAVMAALCGIKETTPSAVLRAVLSAGLDADSNSIWTKMRTFGAEETFWEIAARGTGYSESKPALRRLACHILLTAATRNMRTEHLQGLEKYYSLPHQAFCYDFIFEWLHSADSEPLQGIAQFVEEELRLPQRFSKLTVEDLADTECFPCVDGLILQKLMHDIGNHLIDVDLILTVNEKRRTCVWYGEVQPFYDAIQQIALMQAFYKKHAEGFHTVDPRKIWEDYTETYYQMDTYYRRFHLAYGEALKSYNDSLHDLLVQAKDVTEGLYVTWFLGQLGSKWSDACADELREYGWIQKVLRQEDFYNRKVLPSDSRVFIIISDALRYEVAASLAEQLRRETQSQVTLGSCQGIFPTITEFGMAALLPHKVLSVVEKGGSLSVLADGMSTESGAREKVLKAANSNSVALKYDDIIALKKDARRELVRGKNVVYLYHNAIDEAGHTADGLIFPACETAIRELKNLVRIIVNEFGGANIFITADHGFLYTYAPLSEDSKVDKTTGSDEDVEYGRRYAIMRKGAKPDYLLPVRFLGGKTEYDAFAPRESIRIKMKGGALNFVHGGISLQEMVVPIIEYHYLRNDSKEYQKNRGAYDTKPVTVNLLSATKKISNMIFALNFYQKDAVGGNREPCTYQVYFTDSNGTLISDVQRIIADKMNADIHERTFRCGFSLKPRKYTNTALYYLIIADESGLQAPQKIEFQIDIAFAVDDFDFFS